MDPHDHLLWNKQKFWERYGHESRYQVWDAAPKESEIDWSKMTFRVDVDGWSYPKELFVQKYGYNDGLYEWEMAGQRTSPPMPGDANPYNDPMIAVEGDSGESVESWPALAWEENDGDMFGNLFDESKNFAAVSASVADEAERESDAIQKLRRWAKEISKNKEDKAARTIQAWAKELSENADDDATAQKIQDWATQLMKNEATRKNFQVLAKRLVKTHTSTTTIQNALRELAQSETEEEAAAKIGRWARQLMAREEGDELVGHQFAEWVEQLAHGNAAKLWQDLAAGVTNMPMENQMIAMRRHLNQKNAQGLWGDFANGLLHFDEDADEAALRRWEEFAGGVLELEEDAVDAVANWHDMASQLETREAVQGLLALSETAEAPEPPKLLLTNEPWSEMTGEREGIHVAEPAAESFHQYSVALRQMKDDSETAMATAAEQGDIRGLADAQAYRAALSTLLVAADELQTTFDNKWQKMAAKVQNDAHARDQFQHLAGALVASTANIAQWEDLSQKLFDQDVAFNTLEEVVGKQAMAAACQKLASHGDSAGSWHNFANQLKLRNEAENNVASHQWRVLAASAQAHLHDVESERKSFLAKKTDEQERRDSDLEMDARQQQVRKIKPRNKSNRKSGRNHWKTRVEEKFPQEKNLVFSRQNPKNRIEIQKCYIFQISIFLLPNFFSF